MAEAGIFNLPNETPLRSAELAPLWDAFHYMSARSAEFDFIQSLNEVE
ncbi:MAG: hypothetical protein HC874_14295 [Richelia sp. SL_2_1]|nr:hypothetical protein [Richelia sp. SL_2_1]